MAITFNAATADATFADLFTDDDASTTWYQLYTSDGDGSGSLVDTSMFNDYGNGWIEADDLESLLPDFAQANDELLYVKTWNATDGSSDWSEPGDITFTDIDGVTPTQTIAADTPMDEMFTDANLAEGTWYQLWIGSEDGGDYTGSYVDTSALNEYGNGWVQAENLDQLTFDLDDAGSELWVQTYVEGVGSYGWESWLVEEPEEIFTLTAGAESVDEGSTVTFTLETENVAEGTEVAYTISGVDAEDVDGELTGTAVVGADGTATIDVALTADEATEGEETLTIALDNGEASADVTVNDTSVEIFTLTEDTDFVGPEAPETPEDWDEIFQSTEGDNTIEAVSSSLSSARTLDADDNLDGGDGEDTLNVDMQGNFTGFSEDGGLQNLETVALTNSGSIARTFDASGVTGVEEYVLNNGNAAVNLADLIDAGAQITVNDQASGNLTVAFDTESDVIDDTSDALNVSLNSVGVIDDPATTGDDEEEVVTVTADNIEELNLTTTGDNVVDLGSDDATAITVDGEGSLTMADVGTGLETFNAGSYTGNIDVNLNEASDMTSVANSANSGDTIHNSKQSLIGFSV